jgi:DNA repair protein RecO (recombination protein O)
MSELVSLAILLRKVEYGDNDLILTLLSLDRGKISTIAKQAKTSRKRFGGVLELFSLLNVACRTGRRGGLPVLVEADLKEPFAGIRADFRKTAFASYWAEMVVQWAEEEQAVRPLFRLLAFALKALDEGTNTDEALSVLFQMRFLAHSGLCPNLHHCCNCHTAVDEIRQTTASNSLPRGGLACRDCGPPYFEGMTLSRGTIKQLQWLAAGDLRRAARIRFSPAALREAQAFLEAFVPYHLHKEPRSLRVLQQIRG